ncbi:MAG TPA: hypothetical protein VN703_09250 [Candidatus Sulfopaludibacter sp.]|nr:hypothetical protein [Candidatus Sulfopaludibacter sp.]
MSYETRLSVANEIRKLKLETQECNNVEIIVIICRSIVTSSGKTIAEKRKIITHLSGSSKNKKEEFYKEYRKKYGIKEFTKIIKMKQKKLK